MARRGDLFSGVLPFVRTAEQRSFSKAAAELGVTTAAVSKSVKALEDELGVRLFDRSSRFVTLTAPGEVFLERCRQAVLNVEGARDAMKRSTLEPHGELAVTLPFILAPFVVPGLGTLSARYPRLAFRVNLSDRLAKLAEERFDVALRMGPLESSSLVARLLRRTRWVTVASPSYLARHPAPKQPADTAGHNCLRFVGPDGKPRELLFRHGTRTSAVRTEGNLLIDHGASLLSAAESGMGLCQVLDFMVAEPIQAGRLVEVLQPFAPPGPEIHALTTQARAQSVNVRAFMRFLVEAFAK